MTNFYSVTTDYSHVRKQLQIGFPNMGLLQQKVLMMTSFSSIMTMTAHFYRTTIELCVNRTTALQIDVMNELSLIHI